MITGAAKRVGKETALFLAACGYNIVIHYNKSKEEAVETADEIRKLGKEAFTVQAEFADPSEICGFFKRAEFRHATPSHLINSASIYSPDSFAELNYTDLSRSLNINAITPALLTAEFAGLETAESIINFIDARHKKIIKGFTSYDLSKKLLFEITKSAAIELAPKVRVNAIAPGLIMENSANAEENPDKIRSTMPLKTIGGLDETLNSILFLMESTHITGQIIYTDSGMHLK
jgi:NAD(P)-dependent dehydrogenase (short-subunit alcohol dehydrogenase family)